MSSILQNAILTGYKRRKDKTVTLSFATQEVNSDTIKQIDELQDTYGTLYFKEGKSIPQDAIAAINKADIKKPETKGRSRSQLLRNAIFGYSQRIGQDADSVYGLEIDQLIEHYNTKGR